MPRLTPPRRPRSAAALLAALALTTPGPARADLDLANLYVRKIKQGEKTFLRDKGWSLARNRVDAFYEFDYVSGVFGPDGSGAEPSQLFRQRQRDGDWAGAFSAGVLVRTTPADALVEATAFALVSQLGPIAVDSDSAGVIIGSTAGLAMIVPQAWAREGSTTFKQGMTGGQIRVGPFASATYGLVLDERGGVGRYNHFYELSVPLFVRAQLLSAGPPFDRIERVNVALSAPGVVLSPLLPEWLHFDELTVGYSFLAPNPEITERRFLFARGERLFNYFTFELKLTNQGELAAFQGGLQLGTTGAGDPKRNGKFGAAFDAKLLATVTDAARVSPWGTALDLSPGTLTGLRAELYFQIPAAWFGAALLLIAGSAPNMKEDDRKKTVDAAIGLAESGDEDDGVYAGVTLGLSYQDPNLLADVPNAEGAVRFFMNTRIFY